MITAVPFESAVRAYYLAVTFNHFLIADLADYNFRLFLHT